MNKIEVIYCKDCDLWNAWDKHGNLCSCAHLHKMMQCLYILNLTISVVTQKRSKC